jgi:transposase InsO family protein
LFKESHDEVGQTQSFNGVGAQHQNAKAERSIQTMTYMARSFMIHTALNLGEYGSGDIALLWSLVVNYAAWLYNHIPHRSSGITLLDDFEVQV